jgi:AraC family transcriptional activator of tynA and feaB
MMGVRLEPQCSRHWSTDEVDQRRALSFWIDTVCDRFLELDIDSPLRDRFRACLNLVELGAATANFIDAECQRVSRTQAKIARTPSPAFMLMQLRVGHVRFRQLGREVYLGPSECVFIDATEPYELDCPQATSALALRLPDDWLRRWLPHPERLAARIFTSGGWSAALCAALASLEVNTCDHLALPRGTVAEQIAALLTLAVGPDSQLSASQPNLPAHLMQTLRERYHEADLTPAHVAVEHAISTRSVHYAFARANTTFVDQLMRLRQERAREILSDPRSADLPVTEVAARCGFMDPSHFARRFRQRFAQAPLQFRQSTKRAKRH